MDIGSLLLILGLLLLVALFIARPLMEKRSVAVSQEEHELSALLAERDRIINSLQELDFDYSMGKIPEEEYPEQRSALLQQGANILRQLDDVRGTPGEQEADVRLEAAIAARRAEASRVPVAIAGNGASAVRTLSVVAGPDDDLEAQIASRRRQKKEKAAGFCPQCGGPVQKSDRFCPKCGTKVF